MAIIVAVMTATGSMVKSVRQTVTKHVRETGQRYVEVAGETPSGL